MRTRWIALLVVALGSSLGWAGNGTRAVDWLPDRCVGVIQVYEPQQLLQRVQEWSTWQSEQETLLFTQLQNNQELTQLKIVVLGIAASAGVDMWQAGEAILGEEIAIGIAPSGGSGPGVGIVVRWDKPELAARLVQSSLAIAQLGGSDKEIKVGGQVAYALNNDSYLCVVDDGLLIGNSKRALQALLETRGGKHKSVTSSKAFGEGMRGIPRDAVASVYANLKELRPLIERGQEEGGKLREPLPGFLFGGWNHALRNSPHGVAWARLEQDALLLEAQLPSEVAAPQTHRGYRQVTTQQVAWDARDLPHYLGELQLGRAWGELFREREALLTVAGVSQANNFATTVSNLFGGLDFVNEILPNISGPTRFIMTDQVWPSGQPVPVPHLPAFALVAPLKPDAPKKLAPRLFSAGQMALSLINFDAAQNGQATYLLDVDRYLETRMVFTQFGDYAEAGMQMDAVADAEPLDEETPGEVSVRYNFRPAVTIVDGQIVMATSDELARQIIKQVKQGQLENGGQTVADRFTLDGAALVEILRTNHRELVINRMLEESQSKADATRDIDIFLELLMAIRQFDMSIEPSGNGYLGKAALRFGSGSK